MGYGPAGHGVDNQFELANGHLSQLKLKQKDDSFFTEGLKAESSLHRSKLYMTGWQGLTFWPCLHTSS